MRQTVVRIAENNTLRNFARLGNRDVVDYSFLGKCFKVTRPKTWKAVNGVLTAFSSEEDEAHFWDTYSPLDYPDEEKSVFLAP